MRRDARSLVQDILDAVGDVRSFLAGHDAVHYASNALLRAAVERKLEIAGEAMSRLAKLDPPLAAQITDWRAIIGVRNVLIHGYAEIDDALVYRIAREDLDLLETEARRLLGGLDQQPESS